MHRARALGVMFLIVSCGSDNKTGGSGGVDAPKGNPGIDAPAGSNIDAPGSGSATTGIGETCTPGTGSDTQGTCATGFTCLNLQGGTNAWCSKTCTPGTGDTCGSGYTGPGLAQCILQVSAGSGSGSGSGSAQTFCGVICEDDTGSNQVCPAGTCNDMCPGSLACKEALDNGSGSAVGKACE